MAGYLVSDSLTTTIVPDVGFGGLSTKTFKSISSLFLLSITFPVTNPIAQIPGPSRIELWLNQDIIITLFWDPKQLGHV